MDYGEYQEEYQKNFKKFTIGFYAQLGIFFRFSFLSARYFVLLLLY